MIKLNQFTVNPTIFPDKTSQVWKLPEEGVLEFKHIHISWNFEQEYEVMHLAQIMYLLHQLNKTASLYIDYLPYARQDKKTDLNNSTFALYPFAYIINKLNFTKVLIMDPHSDEALKIIDRSVTMYPWFEFDQACLYEQPDILCYPDKGARDKYSVLHKRPYIWCDKKRDPATGEITELTLQHYMRNIYKKILIVDDLADAGGTFIGVAKLLKQKWPEIEISLFVTHGLFFKGFHALHEAGIKNIYDKTGLRSTHWDHIPLFFRGE